MSRHKVQRKNQVAVARGKAGATITGHGTEETHEFDDSPLPSAEDLVKLNGISPSIIPWLMKRAEDEQSFRHATIRHREEVFASVFKNETHITKSALHWAGVILVVGMVISALLIYNQQTLVGSFLVVQCWLVPYHFSWVVAEAVMVMRRTPRGQPFPSAGSELPLVFSSSYRIYRLVNGWSVPSFLCIATYASTTARHSSE